MANYDTLPFKEQIDFFKGKLKLPASEFNKLSDLAKSKAFSAAGALKQDLVNDLHGAVLSAIKEGKTLNQFKKDFNAISKKHGWGYQGSPNFKARIIYQTNLRQSYNAGRWNQHLETQEERPFLEYVHSGSANPREQHLAWNGVVKPINDSWWDEHYPQNGYGCKCKTFSHSSSSLKRKGLKPTDKAPFEGQTTTHINKKTGEVIQTAKGVDPGFNSNIGKAGFGDAYGASLRSALNAGGKKGYTSLNKATAKDLGMAPLNAVKSQIKPLLKPAQNTTELTRLIQEKVLNGKKYGTLKLGGLNEALYINAGQLSAHLSKDLSRSRYVPFIKDLIENPQEVWGSFEQSNLTKKVHLRKRIIKRFELEGQKDKGLLMVMEEYKAHWVSVTFITISRDSYLESRRYGIRLFKK